MCPSTRNTMKLLVKVVYDTECNEYVAEVPQLPGCRSQGKTVDLALQNARTAVQQYLRAAQDIQIRSVPEIITSEIEVCL